MRYVPLFGCVYESYKHRKWYLAKGIHQMFHPQKPSSYQRSKLSQSFVRSCSDRPRSWWEDQWNWKKSWKRRSWNMRCGGNKWDISVSWLRACWMLERPTFLLFKKSIGCKKNVESGRPWLVGSCSTQKPRNNSFAFFGICVILNCILVLQSFHIRIYNPDSKAKPSLGPKNIFGTITSGCQTTRRGWK